MIDVIIPGRDLNLGPMRLLSLLEFERGDLDHSATTAGVFEPFYRINF